MALSQVSLTAEVTALLEACWFMVNSSMRWVFSGAEKNDTYIHTYWIEYRHSYIHTYIHTNKYSIYKLIYTVKLRMAHYISYSLFDTVEDKLYIHTYKHATINNNTCIHTIWPTLSRLMVSVCICSIMCRDSTLFQRDPNLNDRARSSKADSAPLYMYVCMYVLYVRLYACIYVLRKYDSEQRMYVFT